MVLNQTKLVYTVHESIYFQSCRTHLKTHHLIGQFPSAGHSLATIDKVYYSHEARGDMRIGRLMIADEGTREIMCYPPHWKNQNDERLWECVDECVSCGYLNALPDLKLLQ